MSRLRQARIYPEFEAELNPKNTPTPFLSTSASPKQPKAAVGIVSDPELLQAIKMEMPAWFYDPHVDRVRWINQTLDTMWPSLDQVGR